MHNNGGITMVFMNSNDRAARDQLNKIGGIMSSSEELMNMAMPIVEKVMEPPQQDEPMEMALGGLIPLAATGSRAIQPFLNTIKMGRSARPGMKNVTPPGGGGGGGPFSSGGGSTALVPKKIDITEEAPSFMEKLKRFGVAGGTGALFLRGLVSSLLGDPSVENIEEETNTSIEDLNKQTKAVPADVAKNMTKQELADEFMRVAKNTAIADPGSFAERFGKSMLLGISTKMAAMGDGATGQKSRAEYLYNAIYTTTYNTAIDNGQTPAEAARIAREAATRAAPNAPAALTGGGREQPLPVVIRTQEEYDALPPGTDYVDKNGVPGTKGKTASA